MEEYKNHSGHLSEEAIADYLQQKLSSEEMYAIEKHLLSCTFCADAVDGYEAFADIDIAQTNAKLHDKLQNRTKKRSKKIGYYRLGIAASVILLLAFSVLFLFDVIDDNGDIAINTQEEVKNASTGIEEKLAEELEVESNDSNKIIESKNEKKAIPKSKKRVAKNAELFKNATSSKRKKVTKNESKSFDNAKDNYNLIALTNDSKLEIEPIVEVSKSDTRISSDANLNDAEISYSFDESELAQAYTQEEEVSNTLILPKSKTSRRVAHENSPLLSEKRISGTVHDDNGNPLPGVNVILKNTTKGTTTDIDGKYILVFSEEYNELLFSFIGMESIAMNIDTKGIIDVTMNADASELSEVVVVSGGIMRNEKSLREAYPIGGHNKYKKYLESSLKYPKEALENRIEGMVMLQLNIDRKGNISNIIVLDSLAYGCAQEAIRLVNEGAKWKPAKEDGKKIDSRVILSIAFKLKE